MDRKKFLITASLAACSVSIFGQTKRSNNFNILGPFYRPNAPKSLILSLKELFINRTAFFKTLWFISATQINDLEKI